MKKHLAVMTVIFSTYLMAEVIEVPNQFVSGTKALASEVNANFDMLVVESNSQNTRISAIEASAVSTVHDQLICVTPITWLTHKHPADLCVKQSDPLNRTQPTYADIATEGWVATSVGGSGSGDNIFIFNK